ncbi:MAG: prepilin-type N-terminal cleavage/methylation domain-containing protein [Lentisphaerae bacterium]|jgi:prepilin-type N-terminal cleavage/methylation domain-containing protein|nr:prepilin-type N-terminal cleavage/methylation domain-containing protein [Lentisphaerota bacterium]MBT4817488.1 prepilin-type N-terminal cleavage/methylation domain-containing protein [Lentisphaerota bacterium]MBT5612729.1 prepilin-type N-terminal cleavage/methylation domain-containing protein [Lentisphaerota bacterium]MBT7058958.1 prepilin-type N-terminal cleavage/methylation domain-containing protein [Lentisphaerota bacterium]MBT7848378.1 prepilin-type N-terminal cleavage/methylation domain
MTTTQSQRNSSERNRCHLFSLVELVSVLAVVGILAAIAGTSFAIMAQGFSTARDNSDTAQKAQLAMTRLEKEFTFVTAQPALAGGGTSATYTTEYPGETSAARTVSWNGTVGAPLLLDADILIDSIQSFTVTNTGPNVIEVSLTVDVAGGLTFTTAIYHE